MSKKEKVIVLLLCFLSSVLVSAYWYQKSPSTFPLIIPFGNQKSTLDTIIRQELISLSGEYAVVVKNLKSGETFEFNENKKFQSASLYKLWIMATAYQEIQNGRLKGNEELKNTVEKINETMGIATESAEIKEGEIKMTVSSALERMITVSHNYAAILLSERLGYRKIATFLKNQGLNNSSYKTPPTTTASDIALFYEKLYKGELANSFYTQEMIDLLVRQQLNDRIPKYLPEETRIAHKTGELGSIKHDAGIIFTEKGDYIVVVLTETQNAKKASEHIAKLSEKIYSFHQKK